MPLTSQQRQELLAITAELERRKVIAKWRNDPVAYAKERLHVEMWDGLAEVLESVRDNSQTAVQSANGIGKTTLASILVPWWLETRSPAMVLTTGSSWQALKEQLWPRIHEYINKYDLFQEDCTVLDMDIWIGDHSHAYARSSNAAEGIAGAHSPNLLQIVEESSGISEEIAKAIQGNARGANNRRIYLGNPLAPTGPFYKLCTNKRVHTIKISALQHPNVIEGREVIPGAVTREDVEGDAHDWCTPCVPNTTGAVHLWWLGDNGWVMPDPTFTARDLGDFPSEAEDSMYTRESIERAIALKPSGRPTALGIDVARSPVGDETVFALMNESGVFPLECVRGKDTEWIAGRARELALLYPNLKVGVDDTGVGGGVTDKLRALDVNVLPFNAGESPSPQIPKRFANLKAEWYWKLKERLERSEAFALPDDASLQRQGFGVRRVFSEGFIAVEKKEKYKERMKESPDRWEALVIGHFALNYAGETPAAILEEYNQDYTPEELLQMQRDEMMYR